MATVDKKREGSARLRKSEDLPHSIKPKQPSGKKVRVKIKISGAFCRVLGFGLCLCFLVVLYAKNKKCEVHYFFV